MKFSTFLEVHAPQFKVDTQELKTIVQLLDLYFAGDKEFEEYGQPITGYQENFSLLKGLAFIGSVGSGKSWLMRAIVEFVRRFGGTPEMAKMQIKYVPDIAGDYTEQGRKVYDKLRTGFRAFDELCLTREANGFPEQEYVNHWGNRVLMGELIIRERYIAYEDDGWRTFLTSNAKLPELDRVYGRRSGSRVSQMCNVFVLTSEDRRFKSPNATLRFSFPDSAKPIQSSNPLAGPDIDEQIRKIIKSVYESGSVNKITATFFDFLLDTEPAFAFQNIGTERTADAKVEAVIKHFMQCSDLGMSSPFGMKLPGL